MKTADFNFTHASAAIDEYLTEFARTDKIPTQTSNRVWIEFLLERRGVVRNVRHLSFGQSHAAWYACLVKTRRVREVSRKESAVGLVRRPGGSTENTIRRMLKGNLRDTVSAVQLREFLEPHPALALWEKMFRAAEAEDRIENPSYWVERSIFLDRCAKEGIAVPVHLPDVLDWEVRIGLHAFVQATLDAYFRRSGVERDPMTAGARRLERHMARVGL